MGARNLSALLRRVVAAALVATFAGCASVVRNELTVFHEWPSAAAPLTYRFVRSPAQRDSLAHASYERVLRDGLAGAGFSEAAEPRLEIAFEYAVVRRSRLVVEQAPMFQPYFYLGTGGRRSGPYFGGGIGWPWYPPYEREQTIYEHRLRLQMSDITARPPKRVYEATVSTDAFVADPLVALRYLVRAMLADFPGPSGSARRVDVPVESPPPGR